MRRRHLIPWSTAAVVATASAVIVTALLAPGPGTRAAAATRPATTTVTTTTTAATAQPRTAAAYDVALTAQIRDRMSRSTAKAYGVVVDIDGVGRVVSLNGTTRLLPASTEKLFTSLPWLLNHAQDRLVTTVGVTAAPVAGVVNGDLVVHASGDPTVMGSTLVDLADQVHAAGVSRVTGRLVLDVGQLSTARTRAGWKSSYVPGDIGPLSPFPVHDDVWRTSSAYVRNPTAANLALFRSKLGKAGVKVAGGNAVVRSAQTPTVVATATSTTIASIVAHALTWSDNFQAEQLLAIEGWAPVASSARSAGAGGTVTDGSGLSLRDRRSAADEVALLEYAHSSAAAAILQRSLPLACRTGTLRHEMCKTVAAGKVWAKTGTLDYVKTLAGYTTDGQGRWVTFAFLTSGVSSWDKAMNAIERSVLVVRHYGEPTQ